MSLRAVSLVGLLFTLASLAGVAVGARAVAGDAVVLQAASVAAPTTAPPALGGAPESGAVPAGAATDAGGAEASGETVTPLLLVAATSSPPTPRAGETYEVEVTLENAGDEAIAFLLDAESYVEVEPGEWRKDPQRFQDGLSIEAGATRTYTFHLRSMEPGPHVVKIGAFTPGWGEVLAFWDGALSMTVSAAE